MFTNLPKIQRVCIQYDCALHTVKLVNWRVINNVQNGFTFALDQVVQRIFDLPVNIESRRILFYSSEEKKLMTINIGEQT